MDLPADLASEIGCFPFEKAFLFLFFFFRINLTIKHAIKAVDQPLEIFRKSVKELSIARILVLIIGAAWSRAASPPAG